MSSESSIFLHDRLIRGQVTALEDTGTTTVALILLDAQGARYTNDERFILFIPDDRRLEASLLFHKIAQDLAALLPDVDACCHCIPGLPDAKCAEHGAEAYKINEEAGDECPLCGKPSVAGGPHTACAAREQSEADQGREGCGDPEHCQGHTIPREEAAEHVAPPHRWG